MYFEFERFAAHPFRHAMSRRHSRSPSEGDIGYTRDTDPDHITQNRARFLTSAGVEPASLTLGRQVHGNGVHLVTADDRGRGLPPAFDAIPATDALITSCRDVTLGVIVADCVPVLLYDPVQHALGLVHAGWRGTVAGIVATTVKRMASEFGSLPSDLVAGIGPSIGPCCYEVGAEVIDAWSASSVDEWKSAMVDRRPNPHFDLWQANRMMLEQMGLPPERIEVAGVCTRCNENDYFSHRAAMAGERAQGRMIMIAQLT